MKTIENLSRRRFLKGAAATGSLVLGVHLTANTFIPKAAGAQTASTHLAPNVWLTIAPSGEVTIIASRSEMGQGVRTSLPTILADELEADWSRVTIEQALGDAKYGNQDTDGSRSVRTFYHTMREAGAAARMMLEKAAAEIWQTDLSKVYAKNHKIHMKGSRKSFTFGELATVAARQPVPARENLVLKDEKNFRYIGKDQKIVDLKAITTGAATYGADVRLPGMRFAVIARPPVVGGSVNTFDDTEAKAIPGVETILPLPTTPGAPAFNPLGGVAVVATSTWAALKARDLLTIEWNESPNATYNSSDYRKQIEATARAKGKQVRKEGDFETAHAEAEKTISGDYYSPHLAHAPMEPLAAIANVTEEACEIWAPTQNPQLIAQIAAGLLRLKPEQVRSHATLLGGGFGRKAKPDFAIEALLLSREVGKPVQVFWTREDEIRHGYYHTVAASHLEAGIDGEGKVTSWLHRASMPSIAATFTHGLKHMAPFELSQGMLNLPYDIPNIQVENGEAPAHVRIGWFRSVFNIPSAFAICSFADELAHARNMDPVDNLLDLLGPDRILETNQDDMKNDNYGEPLEEYPFDTGRLASVIKLAAKKAKWGRRRLPKGHALGIAAHYSFLTYVATVVEVRVDEDGTLTIPSAHVAVDCGRVINPDRVKSQMEGACVFATSLALFGEITTSFGVTDQSNFHDYEMARMSTVPDVDVHIVDSDKIPTGIGEPGVPPFTPALCNAIFAATGKRLRELPIGQQIDI